MFENTSLKKCFFHSLRGYEIEPRDLNEQLQILEEIIKSRAILSRSKQNKTYDDGFKNWNGNDYISICYIKSPTYVELASFNYYCRSNSIFIILSPKLLKHVEIRKNAATQIDELQIKDSISIDDFIGIGFSFKDIRIKDKILNILDNLNISLPVIQIDKYNNKNVKIDNQKNIGRER